MNPYDRELNGNSNVGLGMVPQKRQDIDGITATRLALEKKIENLEKLLLEANNRQHIVMSHVDLLKEIRRLRKIEHLAWHVCESADEGYPIIVNRADFLALSKALPTEHPPHGDGTWK